MSQGVLDGVTVLVTRPREQADRLCALIVDRGGNALRFPGLEIRRLRIGNVDDVANVDIVVFVSLNAVTHGLHLLPLPGSAEMPTLAAVGPSTARALRDAGYPCDVEPAQGFSSEALLAEVDMKMVADKRILVVRGKGGRELLGTVLTERGAHVSYIEVYERRAPRSADPTVVRALLDGQVDAVTATSVEILCNIHAAFDGTARHALLDAQLVTISNRVVKKAAELKFRKPAIVAAGPDDRALIAALADWRTSQPSTRGSRGKTMTEPKSGAKAEAAPDDDAPASTVERAVADSRPSGTDTDAAAADERGSSPEPSAEADLAVPKNAATNDAPAKDAATETGGDETQAAGATLEADANATGSDEPPHDMPPARAKPDRSGRAVAWLALIIALASLAAGGWMWRQFRSLPAELEARSDALAIAARGNVDELERKLDDLDARLDRLSRLDDSIARLSTRIDDNAETIDRLGGRLTGTENAVDGLRGVSATARQAWIRAEAEYFLETANQSLALVGDPDVALTALENADDRLQQLGDPGLSRTRAVLADEIAALRAVPRVDIERIVHDLGSLAARVDSFPIDTDRPVSFRGGEPGDADGEDALDRAVSAVKNSLSGMVSVRRSDEKVAPLLAPQETYFLRRNLELQLQAARLAALRGHKANFEESLRAARSWLTAYFENDNAGVAAALDTLTRLEAADIDPALPDISGSLRQLRAAPKPVGDAS